MNWAVVNGSVDVMKKCTELFESTMTKNDPKITWLHIASKYGRQALVESIVQWNDGIGAITSQGMTALHLAAEGGHGITAQKILDCLNNRNSLCQTPQNNTRIGEQSLIRLIDLILQKNHGDDTPIALAANGNHRDICDVLWAEFNRCAKAISKEKLRVKLADRSEDVIELAARYETPGNEEISKMAFQDLLTGKDQRTTKMRQKDWTALHWAVFRSRAIPAWWLLSNGAHLSSAEIKVARDILKEENSDGMVSSSEFKSMKTLLENPPRIVAHPPIEDNYHDPQPPEWGGKASDIPRQESTIVDFYCQDNVVELQDLMTRIAIDSDKKQQDLEVILSYLKQSWTEDPAGGGKRYLQPRYQKNTPKLVSNESNQNAPAKGTDSDTNKTKTTTETAPGGDIKTDTENGYEPPNQIKEELGRQYSAKNSLVSLYIPFLTVAKKGSVSPKCSDKDPTSHIAESVHETMSIDQYYYATILNSEGRDDDQVLSRYLEGEMKREEEKNKERQKQMEDKKNVETPLTRPFLLKRSNPKAKTSSKYITSIFTVDQLWLWISSEELVDTILDDLTIERNGNNITRPQTPAQMMELIVGIATGPSLQKVSTGSDNSSSAARKDALQVFQESIRLIDKEAQIFGDFIKAVKKSRRQRLPERDFGEEFNLLYEIKDIRDELEILKSLAVSQQRVWNKAFRIQNKKPSTPFLYSHPHEPSMVKSELDDMVREAKSAQDSINLFLDLKEKYTASLDADFGRQQAYTTMVFTIVTIIFLPLSFLSSIFALDVSDFPQGSDSPQYKGRWIFPIICLHSDENTE
ncbi:hypothetical protein BO71DRAFT_485749 [Aspergillus ellipticus CBS 707.79]|uniref:Uncharacterized protein n=1 Tax=Aspergillus ellipticus CBS 707.79 TaxID=1448320 RepID=A0A319D3M1_9EURO|nr:hypothetical protein BO71DRAFT_485749 [Aspergillus ellipticus CBS 707.79]